MTLSPWSLGKFWVTGSSEKVRPHNSFYPKHSRGPVIVPVGTRTGDSRIRVSLSNRGGPIKVPGSVNPSNRMKIPKQCPQIQSPIVLHRICFLKLSDTKYLLSLKTTTSQCDSPLFYRAGGAYFLRKFQYSNNTNAKLILYVSIIQITVYIQIYYNIALYLENKRYILLNKSSWSTKICICQCLSVTCLHICTGSVGVAAARPITSRFPMDSKPGHNFTLPGSKCQFLEH
jgi:hypothetical protein